MRAGLASALLAISACIEPGTATVEQGVIGGAMTPEGMYPGVGALYLESLGGVMCTGTLIAPDVVLTAGHCVDPLVLGTEVPGFTLVHDTITTLPAFTPGLRAVKHELFDLAIDPGMGIGTWYDIGLVFLSAPITEVPRVRLPAAADRATLAAGTELALVGYGRTSTVSTVIGVMFDAVAPIVLAGAAELQISRPGDPQNCHGDSGGPALIDTGSGHRVVGVVSRSADGAECTTGGIDTRVDAYLEWIYTNAGVCAPDDPRCPDDPDADGGCCSTSGGDAAGAIVLAISVGLVGLRRRGN